MTSPSDLRLARDILAEFRASDPLWFVRDDRNVMPVHTLALVRGNQWRCIRRGGR